MEPRRTALSYAAWWLVATLIAASLMSVRSAEADTGTADQGTVPIECGGYDEDGRLIDREAASIERAPVSEDGTIAVPEACGGYTASGTFIGDD